MLVLAACENSGGGIRREQNLKPLSIPSNAGTAPATTQGPVPVTQTPLQLNSKSPSAPAVVANPSAPIVGSKLNPAHGQPGHRCDVAVGAPIPATAPVSNTAAIKPAATNTVATTTPVIPPATTTSTAPASGMNPAHGKAGHRCDIAVGQPLNSPPAAKTTTSPVATTAPTLQASPLQTATTAPTPANGLNPAHGQPGHRCDIAVGQPLSSAPVKNKK